MFKRIIITFIFLFFINSIYFYSIPKPKGKNAGALVGKIYLELDKDWDCLPKGKYYRGQVFLINKDTKKKYSAFSNLQGFYYFLNLEPGNYVIKQFDVTITVEYTQYFFEQPLGKTGIDVDISPGEITNAKTIQIYYEILPGRVINSPESFSQPMRTNINFENNLDELKDFFEKKDNKNYWSSFKWLSESK